MKKVDKSAKVPLYLQLTQIIEDMIATGELCAGSCLMPEREICKVQEISRMTVNKALLKLVNDGILERQQGKGTFVASKRKKHPYQNLESLSEIVKNRGLQIKNDLLTFQQILVSHTVQEKLAMDHELGYEIKRVRYIDEDPVILETIFLNPKMCPDLNKELVDRFSLYYLYRTHYGHRLIRAEQIIKPIALNQEQATLLKQPLHTLALQVNRVVYTDQETVMEYTISIFLTQKHDFEIILNQN